MHRPVKESDGWYVQTDDGKSGPWLTEEAAEAAADDDLYTANLLNNQAKNRKVIK